MSSVSEDGARPPLVSVITAVYNGASTLEQCMLSVLRQSYPRIEYIIIDGGSTDGTLEILRKYEHALGRWVSEPDEGIYDALNKGLALARGELIGMIHSDDFYLPLAVESAVNSYLAHGEGVHHGDLVVINEERAKRWIKRPMEHPDAQYLRDMPVNHPSMFVCASLYKRFGGFSMQYRLSSDYEFVCRLLSSHVRFHFINRSIAAFREGGSSGGYRTFKESQAIQVQYGRGRLAARIACWISMAKASIAGSIPIWLLQGLRRLKGSRYMSDT